MPDHEHSHDYHHDTKVKPEAATAVIEFLMMGGITPQTCLGRFPAHHQELNDCSGSFWFYFRIEVTVVLCSWSGRPVLFILHILITLEVSASTSSDAPLE